MRRGRAAYLCYFLSNVPKVLGYRLFRLPPSTKSFRGFPLSIATTSAALIEAIEKDAPFAAIRFGAVELSCLNNHEKSNSVSRKRTRNRFVIPSRTTLGISRQMTFL